MYEKGCASESENGLKCSWSETVIFTLNKRV